MIKSCRRLVGGRLPAASVAGLLMLAALTNRGLPSDQPAGGAKELLAELKNYRHKIVYETNRDGNWDLYLVNADGSNPVNITRTPDIDELYPKPSPDGSKICFVADEWKGSNAGADPKANPNANSNRTKVRNIYY